MHFLRCFVFLVVFLGGTNFRFLPEKVAIGNPLVEGWATLFKAGENQVNRFGRKGELIEIQQHLAKTGQSAEQLAKKIKKAGGFRKWRMEEIKSAFANNYVKLSDGNLKSLSGIRWNKNDGVLDMYVHAEGNKFFVYVENAQGIPQKVALESESLALVIQKAAPNSSDPIRVLSCNNLQSAEKLSGYLNRPVIATDALVRVHPDGGITTIARSGNSSQKWYKLEGGRRVEVNAPKKPDARYKDEFVEMGIFSFLFKRKKLPLSVKFDEIANFRTKNNLPDYMQNNGATGTIAKLEVGKKDVYGANSGLTQVYTLTKQERRDWFDKLLKKGKLKDKSGNDLPHLGFAQFLSHAETEALIKASKIKKKLPKKMTMYVDRVTCNNCKTYMGAILTELNVKELTIYWKNASNAPYIIKAQ